MSIIHVPNVWYVPSAFGDIRLEALDDKKTRIIWFSLTAKEKAALIKLKEASLSRRRKWADEETWKKVGARAFETDDPTEYSVDLDGPIVKVGDVLQRAIRPERRKVTVIRIGQGQITTMASNAFEDMVAEEEPAKEEAKAEDAEGGTTETALAVREETRPAKKEKEVTKAVTVTQPTRGCPAPDFEQIRRRAGRVLRAFLNPGQIEDFEKHQRFVTRGGDTGHEYMLTSRCAPDQLEVYGSRSVYDLTEGRAYCVHDWDCPPEEELLNLHCLLSMPRFESWVRAIPDLAATPVGV